MIVEDKHKDLDYFPIAMPAAQIRPQRGSLVYCTVTRPSGNEQRTTPLNLLIKLTRPGDRDPNQDEDGHQGFTFNLPADIEVNGVDDERARENILIEIQPYEHMAPFDTCSLAWGSEIIKYVVQPSEVGNSFFITVDYLSILRAGDNGQLPVAMQVMDAVGNYPDHFAQWSARQRVLVTLNLDLLDAPYLDDFPGDIDLDVLGDRPLRVSLYADTRTFERDDELTLIGVGRDADGLLIPHTELVPVTLVGRSLHFDIPNEIARPLADGSVTLSYALYKTQDRVTRHSKTLLLTIEEREAIVADDFAGVENRPVGPGEHFDIDSMTISNLNGGALAGIYTIQFHGYFRDQLDVAAISLNHATSHLTGGKPQRIRLTFKFRYTHVKFAITRLHLPGEIYFYNKTKLLSHVELPGQLPHPGQGAWVEYSAPGVDIITHIEIVTRDYSFLDYFSFRT